MCVAYDNEYTASTACSVVQAHTPPCRMCASARAAVLRCCAARRAHVGSWATGRVGVWATKVASQAKNAPSSALYACVIKDARRFGREGWLAPPRASGAQASHAISWPPVRSPVRSRPERPPLALASDHPVLTPAAEGLSAVT